jgi:outer membrane protein assembly factor BamA
MRLPYLFSFAFLFLFPTVISSQNYLIKNINFIGNKKTKPIVIYRELDFRLEDSIDLHVLAKGIDGNEKRLLNTNLFNFCDINLKNIDFEQRTLEVEILVKENWYIYPSIIFELADRNINVWAKEFDYSFKRVNYGLALDHLNTFGYKDRLKFKLQTGFVQKYELDYSSPYLFNKWGLRFNTLYTESKDIGVKTINNIVQFAKFPDEAIMLKRFRIGASAINRMDVFSTQIFKLEYLDNKIDPRIGKELNPSYFLNGANKQTYMRLTYDLDYDKRIFPSYPEGGYALNFELVRNGLGFGNFNSTNINVGIESHKKLSKKLILGAGIRGGHKFTKDPLPYANNEALGYGSNLIRGYELYVLDGKSFLWYKSSLRYKLLDNKINFRKFMPIKAFKIFPYKIFLRSSFEGGYADEPTYKLTNTLNNTNIIGGGLGIDLLILNRSVISLEYNINKQNEKGFFFKGGFNL